MVHLFANGFGFGMRKSLCFSHEGISLYGYIRSAGIQCYYALYICCLLAVGELSSEELIWDAAIKTLQSCTDVLR